MTLPTEIQRLAEIEQGARMAVASGLRMQAMTLRTQADLAASMARTLDAQADAIEDGREPLPSRPVRLEVVRDEPEEEKAAPEPDRKLVQRIEEHMIGEQRATRMFALERGESLSTEVGEMLTVEMGEFLAKFDDRLRSSPHFVPAVNEAADGGLVANDETARWVHDRMGRYEAMERGG